MKLQGIDTSRLDNRKALLAGIDGLRRDIDASGTLAGMDNLTQQAFDILTSTSLADALDISKEPASIIERYGKGDPKNYGDGAPRNLEHFLICLLYTSPSPRDRG